VLSAVCACNEITKASTVIAGRTKKAIDVVRIYLIPAMRRLQKALLQ
jgi:hypothetical protein